MKLLNLLSLIAFLAILSSCQSDPKKEGNTKLQDVSCMLVKSYVLKTIDSAGTTVYINRQGDCFKQTQLSLVTDPFSFTGTGVILEGGFLGTVAHLKKGLIDFDDLEKLNEMLSSELKPGERNKFQEKLSSYLSSGLLATPSEKPWTAYEINSFLILPNSPTLPIQESLDRFPSKNPEYCIAIQLLFDNADKDAAVYKIKGTLPANLGDKAFVIADFMSNEDVKKLENSEPIESWGYPINIRQLMSQEVAPKPARGMVVGLPSSGFEKIETDLAMDQGGSGSFVLLDNKILGLVSSGDPQKRTTLLTPGYYLADLYQNALNAEKNRPK